MIELKSNNVPIKLWTDVSKVESAALDQLKNTASLPWAFHHVAVMPDVHYGKGATVGSVIATKGAICPAAVGVDIGCGIGAVLTNIKASDLPDSLLSLRLDIEDAIPTGFNSHESDHPWGHRDSFLGREAQSLFKEFDQLDSHVQNLQSRARKQCGTLGGGNHFIELCVDTEQNVWMMLHSGSRNIGKELAEIHISKARSLIHNASLPDRDLAAFLSGTPEMEAYRRDLFWAQRYALLNRKIMLYIYAGVLAKHFTKFEHYEPIMCHHNYVSEETHFGEEVIVTRKGAISAKLDEFGIIPGSMGTKSYIVRGLGNSESFCSASHGAGRRMSRGAAKRQYTPDDLIEQTKGIECRKDSGVLDEIPGAYKDIDEVMANQKDLVEVKVELKQVLCVKG